MKHQTFIEPFPIKVAGPIYVGNRLNKLDAPITSPVGGQAVYIDSKALYDIRVISPIISNRSDSWK